MTIWTAISLITCVLLVILFRGIRTLNDNESSYIGMLVLFVLSAATTILSMGRLILVAYQNQMISLDGSFVVLAILVSFVTAQRSYANLAR